METTIYKIRKHYDEMGPAEKRIADYILENTNTIVGVSISDLAQRCNCGDATVVRFAKRLDLDGYQSLKICIAQEFKSTSSVSKAITKRDTCHEIFRKLSNELTFTLQMTASVLNPKSLETAAAWIMNAKRIVLFGLGNSASVANDVMHKLLRLGLSAQSCSDNHMQAIIASHLDRDSLAIGISHSGSSKDIVEALELSKIGGAKTIAVTNHGASPIVKTADLVLYTQSEETHHSILALNSRIAQLLIFDAIYTYIITQADQASLNAIYNTEYALQKKKY